MRKINSIEFIFIVISIIIFCNINGVTGMIFGTSGLISPLLLALSAYVIIKLRTELSDSFRTSFHLNLFFTFLSTYLVMAIISGLVNLDAIHAEVSWLSLIRSYISTFIIIYIFFLITVYFILRNQLEKLLQQVGLILLISVVLSSFSDYLGITDTYDAIIASKILGERSGGLFGNPNEAGAQALYCLTFMLYFFLKGKNRLLYIGAIIVSFYLAFISFSKAALIMAAIIPVMFVMWGLFKFSYYTRRGKSRIAQLMAIFVIVMLIFPAYFMTNIYSNLEADQLRRVDQSLSIVTGDINEENTSARLLLVEKGIELIKESPILGNGLGSFHKIENIGLGVHSGYIMILGESGVIPFFILLICLVLYLKKALHWPNSQHAILFLALLLTFYIQVILPTHGAFEDRSLNALLGVILGCYKMEEYAGYRMMKTRE